MRKKSTAAEDKNYDLSKFSQKKENKNLYFKPAVRKSLFFLTKFNTQIKFSHVLFIEADIDIKYHNNREYIQTPRLSFVNDFV